MSHHWATGCVFKSIVLQVEERDCPECGRFMHVCDHRVRRIFTLQEPWQLTCKLVHCPDPACPNYHRTFSPEGELGIAPPQWAVGWDVFCWVGHRRLARHWSVPQIRAELADTWRIPLSADAIEKYIRRYQTMLAARHQDPSLLGEEYRKARHLVLSIDGLQPEKGHETLYVVRELTQRRVWFAQSLLSSSAAEVQRLLEVARDWASRLGKPVMAWVSDKQDAFLSGMEAVFPGVPHRLCHNHFLRDLAKPMLEADSTAKVQMRSKVRGLRKIEKQILAQTQAVEAKQAAEAKAGPAAAAEAEGPARETMPGMAALPAATEAATMSAADQAVLDYCAATRGILNQNQGGPLRPPGLEMARSLTEVRASIQRNLEAKKGGPRKSGSRSWPGASTGGWSRSGRS